MPGGGGNIRRDQRTGPRSAADGLICRGRGQSPARPCSFPERPWPRGANPCVRIPQGASVSEVDLAVIRFSRRPRSGPVRWFANGATLGTHASTRTTRPAAEHLRDAGSRSSEILVVIAIIRDSRVDRLHPRQTGHRRREVGADKGHHPPETFVGAYQGDVGDKIPGISHRRAGRGVSIIDAQINAARAAGVYNRIRTPPSPAWACSCSPGVHPRRLTRASAHLDPKLVTTGPLVSGRHRFPTRARPTRTTSRSRQRPSRTRVGTPHPLRSSQVRWRLRIGDPPATGR